MYTVSDFPFKTVLTDSLITAFVFAMAIWGVMLIINAYPTQVVIILYAFVIATIFALAAAYVDWQLLKLVTKKTDLQYRVWLGHTMPVRYCIFWLITGWIATYAAFKKQTGTLKAKFAQQADASALLRDAELYKLRQQLQPHFLYNSLNSISALTMIEPAKAQEMIGKLSDFLRSSVRREGQEQIPVAEEMVYIESYLAIESVRFGDRLNVVFEKEYTDHAKIPPFLLQPLLENAIKFGLYGKTGQVTVSVRIAYEAPYLIITIQNPYDSTGQPPKGTGFGLMGIERRLYLLYARKDLLETHQENETFTTVLKIPQSHV
jgi:LytS/YehU family sensor histidine kinase